MTPLFLKFIDKVSARETNDGVVQYELLVFKGKAHITGTKFVYQYED